MKRFEGLFQKGLLAIAQDVHMNLTGASDSLMLDEDMTEHVDYLRMRLNEWNGPHTRTAEFDMRVKDLVTTVLDEFDKGEN